MNLETITRTPRNRTHKTPADLKYYKKLNDESFRMFIDLLGLNLAHPKKIKTPLLILGAENDNAITPDQVHATARGYGVKAEMFPNMAHDIMLENDWQTVPKEY